MMTKEKLCIAGEKLRLVLSGGLRSKLRLDLNTAPTIEQLCENKYADLVNYIHFNKLKYKDVIESVGLKRNDEENRTRAARMLLDILNDGLKEQLGFSRWQAPTKDQIRSFGCHKILWFIYKKGLTYNEVVSAAGLKPNSKRNIWTNIGINKASRLLINFINKDLKRKLGLNENMAPTRAQLGENGDSAFLEKRPPSFKNE
jgi:hypothetical protein